MKTDAEIKEFIDGREALTKCELMRFMYLGFVKNQGCMTRPQAKRWWFYVLETKKWEVLKEYKKEKMLLTAVNTGESNKKRHRANDKKRRGKKYNRLTYLSDTGQRINNHQQVAKWRCDCGEIVLIRLASVIYGNTKSCGCLKKETDARGNKFRMFGRVYNEDIRVKEWGATRIKRLLEKHYGLSLNEVTIRKYKKDLKNVLKKAT